MYGQIENYNKICWY